MRLTSQERAMLAGSQGPGVQKAIEIIVALGKIYGAEDLVPVSSVQVSGVSYKNLGQAGLAFLRQWAEEGARVRVPTTLNPAGMDLDDWQQHGIPEIFARQQQAVIAAFAAMGVTTTCTCTPYYIGHEPGFGEHLAWAESSAVSYANSVLGARTNREGGPSALAAAIAGRTARYGLHLDAKRKANWIVDVRCPLESAADYGALGYAVGQKVRQGIPLFRNLAEPLLALEQDFSLPVYQSTALPDAAVDRLKALGAAMAASGAVALYHVEGITPEAMQGEVVAPGAETLAIKSLDEAYAALNGPVDSIDFVGIGCPHASPEEIRQIAETVDGRQLRATLWVTTARGTKQLAAERGWVQAIEAAGGHVVADTCVVVAPVGELGFRTMATNAGKAAFYSPGHSGLQVRFGSLQQCVAAAIAGQWEADREP
ncbi:MAG: aconitase X catalytic domain-containing protein [Anaerolineae bacterium]|nr:MAG: aconitase X catalytic domain-containing protein [Anaerolineae bacterium]